MKQSQTPHLPVMGAGPIYVISIVIITIFAITFSHANTSLPTNIQAPNTPVTNSTSSNLTSVSDSAPSGTQSVSQIFTLSATFPPRTPVATVLAILGILIILVGLIIYVLAIKIKITKAIKENRLLTTGIYSVVRNPIYSA